MKKYAVTVTLLPVYVFAFTVLILGAIIANRSVTTLVAENKDFSRKCVVIDPGHGGVDGGATSCSGILESTLNLQISLRLNDLMH